MNINIDFNALGNAFGQIILVPFQAIATLLLAILDKILSGVEYTLPTSAITSVNTLVTYIFYLKDWFPVVTLLEVAGALLALTSVVYTVKFGLWLLSFIPGTKIPQYFPTVSTAYEADQNVPFGGIIKRWRQRNK